MKHLTLLIRIIALSIALLMLMASCSRNRYKPVSENFSSILKGQTALDTLFVSTMAADSPDAFDSETDKFLAAYARDFDDPGTSKFSVQSPYSLRQDSILFLMQDYLLNTYRYEESIELGLLLDRRLAAHHYNSPLRSAALGDISVAYFYIGNLDEAIKHQSIGYEIDLTNNDAQLISSDLNQLAGICLRAGKYDLARDYILDAIKVEEPLGRAASLAIRYGMASEIYLKLNDYATAADYARKALELDSNEGREGKVGIRLSQLAAIQIAQNDNEAAEESLAKAIPLLKNSNNINSLAIANCQLGELALRKDNDAKAQQYFYEALLLCRSAGIKPIEKRALRGLWLSMKDTSPALGAEYLKHYSALSDSLSTVDSDSQLASLKADFATRELRMENERLEAQNRNNRIIISICAILFVLLCLVAWLIYRNRIARQHLLHHLERIRINFFTHITHEFRTPLTVILGLSAELEKKDNARAQAELISEEGRNLLNLVNQLLDIGKLNSSAGNPEWCHGNIIGYLSMLVESLRPLAVRNNVELVFAPANNNVEMDFAPDYIRKIVMNILSNALKYTQNDGHVLISVRAEDSKLVMRFADNGIGIDTDDLDHIFEPFYQGTNSKTAVGTGIGLSLVKLLVDAMDGKISVKSSRGIGTAFIVTLPLKHEDANETIAPFDDSDLSLPSYVSQKPSASASSQEEEENQEDERQRPAVLIVEDNTNVANYIASQLSDKYIIYKARNGEEGYNKALSIVPDLIITDIMMPVMDGIEMLKKLRQSDILNHLPVIMITALATDTNRIEGITEGADAYITKPFNPDELRAIAARLIEQRRLLCEKYRNLADNPDSADDVSNDDRAFMERLINVIYHLISNERRTDICELATFLNISDRTLSRKILALTGESTTTFVNRVKIDKAKRLLDADSNSSLTDIAMRCGFDDPAYFSRIFKQTEGLSPTAYRRRVR